jgi:hypothetical protein
MNINCFALKILVSAVRFRLPAPPNIKELAKHASSFFCENVQ